MNKLSIYSLCIILILVSISGCYDRSDAKNIPPESSQKSTQTEASHWQNNCKLIVNGKDISNKYYVHMYINEKYAELPLIAIMKELGATENWKNSTIVHFQYDNTTYILNTEKNSVRREGKTWNFIAPPPGTPGGQNITNIPNEYMISDSCIRFLLIELGFDIKIDYNQAIIYIEKTS